VNVFFDTDVLLDVLANRQPFYADAASLWSLADSGKISASISAITYPNVYYVLRKNLGWRQAREVLREMEGIFHIVACDKALSIDTPDFEDAIQFLSASQARARYIITRDSSGFKKSSIPAITPAGFLASHSKL
jgi:predicted nucleic acid-binding protein